MKKLRRAPFVVTVAIAAASSACGGSTSSGDGTGGTGGSTTGGSGGVGVGGYGTGGSGANPPSIPCPADLPAEGSACPQGSFWGNSCAFVDPCGGPEPFYAECNQQTGQWHLLGSTECACPESPPTYGEACSVPSTQSCSYPSGCCPEEFQCLNGTWSPSGVSCNPPPLLCPEAPPPAGSPCEPCALGSCNWNTCDSGGSELTGSCANGAWQVTATPCLDPSQDGGT